MNKGYYYITFFQMQRPSPLADPRKQLTAIEAMAVIDTHPFVWLAEASKTTITRINYMSEITKEEYEYFQENISKVN